MEGPFDLRGVKHALLAIPASVGSFEVRVCRFFGEPLSGATVAVGPNSQPSVRLGREAEPVPQPLLSCVSPYVRTVTNANGQAFFTIAGSMDLTQGDGSTAPTVTIYANGYSLGSVPVVCYDLDGASGVGANDLALWLELFGSGAQWLFADYNGDGQVGADDLSMWLDVFGSGAQAVSATPICP